MRIVIGIPARMGSTRFPGKPLCKILGKTMIEHCFKRSSFSNHVTEVFIAGCDQEVEKEVKKFKGNFIMTEKNISRPGLRVAAAAEKLNLNDEDIVVVVQGDEPLLNPEMIDLAIKPLIENNDILVSNLCSVITENEWSDPGEVKVVCDLEMNALYMSRSPIPSVAHEELRAVWWKQVCIMPFKWHFMKKFNYELEETPLELQESIEMIRAIQHGYKIRMIPSPYLTKSVDTEDDRKIAEELMLNDQLYLKYNET
jgi:3-deoxy-manno-octulosonate cytidylyltransferase (CMP-KDO synthetase)